MRDLPENIEVVWGWVKSEDNAADITSRTDAVPVTTIRKAHQAGYHGRLEGPPERRNEETDTRPSSRTQKMKLRNREAVSLYPKSMNSTT
jgi:hypothetical protein